MKLLKGRKWKDWRKSKWKQLDQYKEQGIFGNQMELMLRETVFILVWTYNVKVNVMDQRKKVCCECDVSVRNG